jgi:DNA-binding XRE family transcriptional regulator
VGEHLKRRRLDFGLLQREVAEQIGVDKATLYNWEKGRSEAELRFYPAIIRFLGYDPTVPDPSLSIGELLRPPAGRGVYPRRRLRDSSGSTPSRCAIGRRGESRGDPTGE